MNTEDSISRPLSDHIRHPTTIRLEFIEAFHLALIFLIIVGISILKENNSLYQQTKMEVVRYGVSGRNNQQVGASTEVVEE